MKIPVPKEAVTQIMNDYNCSEEQAAKAYLDAQDKANETVKAFLAEQFGSSRSADDKHKPRIYTPREIKDHLDKYVIGQEEYKKTAFNCGRLPFCHDKASLSAKTPMI